MSSRKSFFLGGVLLGVHHVWGLAPILYVFCDVLMVGESEICGSTLLFWTGCSEVGEGDVALS